MTEKVWIEVQLDEMQQKQVQQLEKMLHCMPVVGQLLVSRGLTDRAAVEHFLSADLQELEDPFQMKGMEQACQVIGRAIRQHWPITIYGDYDVDGVTSTSTLMTYFRHIGCPADYYIPDRMEEGYGMNQEAVRRIAQRGAKLIITVDCGITAVQEVELAHALGMQVVVTDHHQCAEQLPQADALINPHQPGCTYPFQELAGVGVAFKLVCALHRSLGGRVDESFLEYFLDIVSIGTIADVMPLLGENRMIVRRGLERIRTSERPGLRALLQHSGVQPGKKITAGTVGFTLAPRINAAGRVGSAQCAVQLLLTEDHVEAHGLAQQLCEENQLRQKTENDIMQQALAMLHEQGFDAARDRIVVLWHEGWHHGVIGIVASRINDIYHCPVILIALEGEEGKGSGRSIEGFHLFHALEHCGDLLARFGGHEMAAGLTVARSNLESLRVRLIKYAAAHLTPEDLVPRLRVDARLQEADLQVQTVRDIARLEPYGVGNPMPVFRVDDLEIVDIVAISNDKHLRLLLRKGETTITAFAFSTRVEDFPFSRRDRIDVACTVDVNEYRGRESVQLVLKDVHLTEAQSRQEEAYRLLYHQVRTHTVSPGQVAAVLPDRRSFVAVYSYMKQKSVAGCFRGDLRMLDREIAWYSRTALNYATMMICLDVLEEFQLIQYQVEQDGIIIRLLEREGKVNLNDSHILQMLRGL